MRREKVERMLSTDHKCRLKAIVILSDGIRGHLNQSRGITGWLSKMTGAEILELEVPLLKNAVKLRARSEAKGLAAGNKRDARDWINKFEGESLVRQVGQWFAERNIYEGSREVLLISAGSAAAPYNLALSYIWRCACATVMTPSGLGTDPFDFAIVPEHDYPAPKSNVFVTLGSPNSVVKEDLVKEGEQLLADFPSAAGKKWSVLIGGDDANYSIGAAWIEKNIGLILRSAEIEDADLYITTSRRTQPAAAEALKKLAGGTERIKYLLIAAEDPINPIPAMLGFSNEVFCTDDSVNMVSETVTGGHCVILMRAGRKYGPKMLLQKITSWLAERDAVSHASVWGVPKFDRVFFRFARHGALVEFDDWIHGKRERLSYEWDEAEREKWNDFNESHRAAQWICTNWK